MDTDFRLKYSVLVELGECGIVIPRTPNPTRKRTPTVNPKVVFGVPLENVIENRGTFIGKLHVPESLMQMASIIRTGLATEGLFRVSGSAARMKSIQAEVDLGGRVSGLIHDIAGVMKTFLRSLPEPLLSYRLYQPLIEASQLPDSDTRLKAVLLLLLELPIAHLHTTIYLMQLLHDVVSSPGSRMTANNLAAIFTPNILRPREHDGAVLTSERELANHAKAVSVTEMLILNHEQIGNAPMEVVRKAADVDEDKAKASYLKMIIEKPHSSWWIFGKKGTHRERKPPNRKESLSSAETLELIRTGNTVEKELKLKDLKKGKIPGRSESQASTKSDTPQGKPPGKRMFRLFGKSSSNDSIASNPDIMTEAEKENKLHKFEKAKSKENMRKSKENQGEFREGNDNGGGPEGGDNGNYDDPPVPDISKTAPKDLPGFDSFMMY